MKNLVLVMMVVLTTFFSTSKIIAQEIQINWQQILTSETLSYTSGEIKILADGDVIMVGTVYNTVEEQSDILLARFDESGELLWSHLFGGEENEEGQSVVPLSTGGFLVGGSTVSYGNGGNDIFILRVEDDGDLVWQETYGTAANEGACRIREVADGYIASGFKTSQNDPTLLLVKFDEYGDMEWNRSYTTLGELGIINGMTVEPLSQGGYIATGIFKAYNDSLQSMVVKLDVDGDVVWSKQINGICSESIFDIKVLSNGYLLCGKSYLDTINSFDAHIVKLDLNGDVIWDRYYGSRNNEEFNQIVLLDEGEFMLTGTITDDQNVSMPWVVQMSSWGDTLSGGIIPVDGTGKGVSITAKPDDGSIILANTVILSGAELSSIQLAAYLIPCPIWYPRALQINNLWCTSPNGTCYPNLPKILTDATDISADSLVSYIQKNKITNLMLGDLSPIFFEDVGNVDRDTTVEGADLRDSLATLITRLRGSSNMVDVTAVLRDENDEDVADTTKNMALINLIASYNQGHLATARINELCLDYEFWRDRYGDPGNLDSLTLYPNLSLGWQHYRAISNKMKTIKANSANLISTISTILGRMDRNIDNDLNTGSVGDGEDENSIVDFADSTFSRVYLFFYIPDMTLGPDTSRTPIRFMTGWGDFDQLAERIYHFGNNSTMSNIWPMFSAEDYMSPNDANIYLGDWLQGTEFWTPQQHYLTEVQNIFRDQVPYYVQNTILPNYPSWNASLKLEGYAFFKYGLATLDTIRIQDRAPNVYSNYDCFSARYANTNLQDGAESNVQLTPISTYLKAGESYFVYSYLGQEYGKLSYNQVLTLPKGSYILENEKSLVRIIFNNY